MAVGRPPGIPKTGGRKKGVPNKVTSATREAFLKVFEGLQKAGHLKRWIMETGDGKPAKDGKPEIVARPDRAAELLLKYAEFCHPKARTEITGEDGGNLVVEIVSLAEGK